MFAGCIGIKELVIPAGARINFTTSTTNPLIGVFAGWTEDQTIYIEGGEAQVADWVAGWDHDCKANIVYGPKA